MVNTLKGKQRSPEHLARNPFGLLPVLELDDGSYIIESLTIIEYLEERFPAAPLWGDTPEARAQARQTERIVELKVTAPLGQYVHATNSPLGLPKDPVAAERLEASLPIALGYIDNMLSDGRPLLMGDRATVADCTLQAGLQFMRFGKVDIIGDYPNLVRWDQAYRSRPAAQAVLKF